jgi:hypothetical protein
VTAEAISFERYLQILDPVLGLAAFCIVLVEFVRAIGLVGYYKAGVGALLHHLCLVDDPALDLPASRLVAAFRYEPDLSLVFYVAFLGFVE